MSLEKKSATKTELAQIAGLDDILSKRDKISDWSLPPEKSMEFSVLATTSSTTIKQSEKRSGGMPKSASFTGRSNIANYGSSSPGARKHSSSFDKPTFSAPFFIFVEQIGLDRTRDDIFKFFGGDGCVKSLHMYRNDDNSFTGDCFIELYDRILFNSALAKGGECMQSQKIVIYAIENGFNRRHLAEHVMKNLDNYRNTGYSSGSRKSSPGLTHNRQLQTAQSQDVRNDQINRKPTHTTSQYRTFTRNFGNNVQNTSVDENSSRPPRPRTFHRNVSTAPANDSTSANAKQSDRLSSKPSHVAIFGEAKANDKTYQKTVEIEKQLQSEKKQGKKISKDMNIKNAEDVKPKEKDLVKSEVSKPKEKSHGKSGDGKQKENNLEKSEAGKPNEKNLEKTEDGKLKGGNQAKPEDKNQHSEGKKNRKKPENKDITKD